MRFDSFCMDLAKFIAKKSKDRSRKIGCVIIGPDNEVRSTGYNGFPRNVNDDVEERHQRPEKYFWTEHAERNAIYNAARIGTSLKGCRIYTSWFPCIDCARAIVQSGIIEIITYSPELDDPQWGTSFKKVIELFEETGIIVRYLDEEEDNKFNETFKSLYGTLDPSINLGFDE